jgi:tetratricopeptide (TPR) repeat protein
MKIIFIITLFTLSACGQVKNQQYEKLNNEGLKLLKTGEFLYASEKYKQALNIDSLRIEANYGLGVTKAALCYQTNQNCDDALKYLLKARTILPNYRKTEYNIGVCYMALEKYLDAVNAFNKYIKTNSSSGDAYFNRGYANLMLEKKTKACENFKKAIKYGNVISNDILSSACN